MSVINSYFREFYIFLTFAYDISQSVIIYTWYIHRLVAEVCWSLSEGSTLDMSPEHKEPRTAKRRQNEGLFLFLYWTLLLHTIWGACINQLIIPLRCPRGAIFEKDLAILLLSPESLSPLHFCCTCWIWVAINLLRAWTECVSVGTTLLASLSAYAETFLIHVLYWFVSTKIFSGRLGAPHLISLKSILV